jgi:LmbE family N-acetylglucosaminyl deacetylase
VGAHPDDVELGSGGFLAKCIDCGCEAHYVVLSPCKKNTGLDHAPETLVNEAKKATATLGIKQENVTFFDFENTRLPSHAHEIRTTLEGIRNQVKPSLVLCPSTTDPHQDHATVGMESLRTFRSGEFVFAYELLRHGSYLFDPNLFVDISKYMETKIKALLCYKSQIGKRSYFAPETFRALARTRAAQAGYGYDPKTYLYAEAFTILKMYL